MAFVTRCLRVKNPKRPFATRCKNKVMASKMGLLCKACEGDALSGDVHILMHNAVSAKLKIPYKNQLTVKINLSKDNSRPESKSALDSKIKRNKSKLTTRFNTMNFKVLKSYHDRLGLNIWDIVKKKATTEYAFKYTIVQELINKLLVLSSDG
jgi:hypothetical protein